MMTHPNAKPADVAAKFKASLAYVYVIRSQMKKAEATRKFRHPDGTPKIRMQSSETVPPAPAEEWKTVAVVSSGTSINDMINPAHYKAGGIETIDFIEAKKLNYHLGNVVKYITRADLKGERLENLKKAKWYLDREIAQG
jgi:hypothetical protein